MRKTILIIIFVLCAAGVSPSWAEDPPKNNETPVVSKSVDKTHSQLMQITKRIVIIRKELKELEKKSSSKEAADRIVSLHKELDDLTENYEALATQIPKEEIPKDQPKPRGWLEELNEITRPFLNSLREITERPRKIDNLKAVIADLESQIETYKTARKHILSLESSDFDFPDIINKDSKKTIKSSELQAEFKEELSKLKDQYDPEILLLELEEARRNLKNLQDSNKSLFSLAGEGISQFMKVRGRNLVVALAFLFGVWWILTLLYRKFESRTGLLHKVKRSTRKLTKTVYYVSVFFIAFFASLFSLYIVNDWLLLSLLFLSVLAIGWTFREFFPKFLNELYLILNLGTVREGERIIYEGIPWLVKEIGFHVVLQNPRLEGGIIRIPVGKLIGYSSREFVKEEEWFPTEIGDWVLIDDAIYGQVVIQTPELVILKNMESRRTYLTPEFLTLKPRNLSTGYLIVIKFGLDYSIQDKVCNEIPGLFQASLEKTFKDALESEPPKIQSLKVRFDHAGASSLDLAVLAHVDGSHADEYHSLRREISKALVAICNEEGLTIPFNQMTLSMAPNESEMDGLRKPTLDTLGEKESRLQHD